MSDEIRLRLNHVFREVFKDKTIEVFDEMTANDIERWDSLSHLTMIDAVENEFGIKFKLKELIAMINVGDLIQGIRLKTGLKSNA